MMNLDQGIGPPNFENVVAPLRKNKKVTTYAIPCDARYTNIKSTERYRVSCRQYFFAVRVLRIWNSLPEEVVSADHLSLFVRLLKRVVSQLLVGKV